jgi:conjugal transfer pilus assembly protein TrbC
MPLLVVLAGVRATAQPTTVVTEADVANAARSQPKISEADIAKAQKKFAMPSDAELARVPVPSTPNLEALPQPLNNRPMDLASLAKGYETMAAQDSASGSGLAEGPSLLIFASFAMPEPTFARLVDQAARAQATIVIRGFVDGSLKTTVARAQHLIGQRRVAFQIDPQAFDRFAVQRTPSFVLLRAGAKPASCAAGTCFDTSAFVSAAGDVSLDYALEFFEQRSPQFAKDAAVFLKRLRGR